MPCDIDNHLEEGFEIPLPESEEIENSEKESEQEYADLLRRISRQRFPRLPGVPDDIGGSLPEQFEVPLPESERGKGFGGERKKKSAYGPQIGDKDGESRTDGFGDFERKMKTESIRSTTVSFPNGKKTPPYSDDASYQFRIPGRSFLHIPK